VVPYDEFYCCLFGSLAPSMYTLFCSPVVYGECCAHYPMICPDRGCVIHLHGSIVLIKASIRPTLSTSVLQLLKATHISVTLHMLSTPLLVGDEISASAHASRSRIESHCVLRYWTMFPVDLPYLNSLYDEMTHFWCPLMAVC
jgi:hypothetical protein